MADARFCKLDGLPWCESCFFVLIYSGVCYFLCVFTFLRLFLSCVYVLGYCVLRMLLVFFVGLFFFSLRFSFPVCLPVILTVFLFSVLFCFFFAFVWCSCVLFLCSISGEHSQNHKWCCVHRGVYMFFRPIVSSDFRSPRFGMFQVFRHVYTWGLLRPLPCHAMPCHSRLRSYRWQKVNTSCRLLQPAKHSYSDEGFFPRTYLVVRDHACLPEESGCHRWVGIILPLIHAIRGATGGKPWCCVGLYSHAPSPLLPA